MNLNIYYSIEYITHKTCILRLTQDLKPEHLYVCSTW